MFRQRRARIQYGVAAACMLTFSAAGCSQSPGKQTHPKAGDEPPSVSVQISVPTAQTTPTRQRHKKSHIAVDLRLRVQKSAVTRTLAAFVRARTESMLAGKALPRLKEVSTPHQFALQQRVVADASARGLAVPREPVVRVVSRMSRSPRKVRLAVCFWLPSTEYVDSQTGRPAHEPVPREWLPAVATLVRQHRSTWQVDSIVSPHNQKERIRCGGVP